MKTLSSLVPVPHVTRRVSSNPNHLSLSSSGLLGSCHRPVIIGELRLTVFHFGFSNQINLEMLRRNKRARADSGEIIEYITPLPRAQPAPPEIRIFRPAPALPNTQTREEIPAVPGVSSGVDEKTRVGAQQ